VAEALREALALPEEERQARNKPMRDRVMKYDAGHWARTFMEQLRAASEEEIAPETGRIQQLAESLGAAVADRRQIALFLDYDGTLREIERDPRAARPNENVRTLLAALRDHRQFDVTVISGRTSNDLAGWLGDYPFALIAEHGAAIRRAGTKEWEMLDDGVSYAWKEEMLPILRSYEQSTPGSSVEEKKTSLVWHYRNTDPEFGAWKAHQLAVELGAMMANEPVKIHHGRKIVEASASTISKGAAVQRLLAEKQYDLALCAGDDQTDESMFELKMPNLITIKVGPLPSRAQYRIATPTEFRAFLRNALLRA
jgi:trehalose 6-phosphate synthase/phosphatase